MASLGQTLLQRRDINLIQLNLALDFRVFYGGRLGTNLLELGIISEDTLAEALAEHMGVPCVKRLDLENISLAVIQKIPREVAFRAQALPFRHAGSMLYVAMADPRNERAIREIRQHVSGDVLLHVAPELRIQLALEQYYQIRMEPRMQNLAAKVESHHELRPPGVFQGMRPTPVTSEPPPPFHFNDWVTDEGESLAPSKTTSSSKKVTLSVQKMALMLEEATTRDEIAELALQFAQKYVQRVALFVLRKDLGFGWDGRGPEMSRERVKAIMIPLGEPSIFQTVVESQGHFLGEVPDTPVNNQFLTALGGVRPKNVLLLPLTIGGITFGTIYGDNGENQVNADGINELQVMICRVNIAFEKLIIAERQKALRHHASI